MRQNPIIYSCSGCSIAGQYAYKLALLLDKKGIAELSYIAGLASGKKYFLKKHSIETLGLLMVAQYNVGKRY